MQSLTSFRNRHEGETVLVCGCGESLNELRNPERFLTIGVNDAGRRFQRTIWSSSVLAADLGSKVESKGNSEMISLLRLEELFRPVLNKDSID